MSSNSNKSDVLKGFQSSQNNDWHTVSRRGRNQNSTDNETVAIQETQTTGSKFSNISSHLQSYKEMKDRRFAENESNGEKKSTRDYSVLHNIRDKQDQRKVQYESTKQYMYRRPNEQTEVYKPHIKQELPDLNSFPTLVASNIEPSQNFGIWGQKDKVNVIKEKHATEVTVVTRNRSKNNSNEVIVTEISVMTDLSPIYADLIANTPLENDKPVEQLIDDDGFQSCPKKRKGKKSLI